MSSPTRNSIRKAIKCCKNFFIRQEWIWRGLDYLFPVVNPVSDIQRSKDKRKADKEREDLQEKCRAGINGSDKEKRDEVIHCIQTAFEAEEERDRRVESKLTSMLTFGTAALSVVLALIGMLTQGSIISGNNALRWIVLLGFGYIAIQFCRTGFAALNGLGRRSWARPSFDQLLPESKNTDDWDQQIACVYINATLINRETINRKVEQMAIAHVAIRNAIFVLLILIISAVCFALSYEKTNVAQIDKSHRSSNQSNTSKEFIRGSKGDSVSPGIAGSLNSHKSR